MKVKFDISDGNDVDCDTIFIELPNGKKYSISEAATYEGDPVITIMAITLPSPTINILPQASNSIILL